MTATKEPTGEPPPPIDPDDETALQRLADDGNPIHQDQDIHRPAAS